jgi:hypothetical protein
MPDTNEIQTSQNLRKMSARRMYDNPKFQNGFDILNNHRNMLTYSPDGKVIIHSTVGRAFQGLKSNQPKICQETQDVEELLEEFYSTEKTPPEIIRSENVNALCSPSGGSKSRRRKTHNKHASRSKSKTQRRRRARMSRR